MFNKSTWLLLSIVAFTKVNGQAHYIKFRQDDNHSCIILEENYLPHFKGFEGISELEMKIFTKPALKAPGDAKYPVKSGEDIVEAYGRSEDAVREYLRSACPKQRKVLPSSRNPKLLRAAPTPEIRKIVDSGDQKNRIDVVFMGDGYTAEEKENCFEDIARLTRDMFEGVTFRSYLPVFNIWAVYVESEESGIGYDGPKNTPFRLYREKGQLRVILPGNEEYAREVCAMTGASGCDYPSLIANDNFYGGVGGEFVISTRSERTGTFVLRHEMGHNFAAVGDEYDNSWAYFGVNSAPNVQSLGWTHWLTTDKKREERAIYRLLEYPWADLQDGDQSFTFTSDGSYSRWELVLSVSAAGEEDSLEFLMDGKALPWKTTGYDDREFYTWKGEEGFSQGSHTFTVRTKTNSTHPDIPRMICSITLHETGNEDEFVTDRGHVSAYPTWDDKRQKTLRPTNDDCLMRYVTNEQFCSVCKEGMWYEFLSKVSLIDSLKASDQSSNGTREVTLETIKLGQLRTGAWKLEGEKLEVKWFLSNTEQTEFRDQFVIRATPGVWSAQVHFVTPEVRSDPRGLTTSSAQVTVAP